MKLTPAQGELVIAGIALVCILLGLGAMAWMSGNLI